MVKVKPPIPAYIPGDLLWAKVGGAPYWPCMVAYNPNNALFYEQKKNGLVYNVQYFGKKTLRGQVNGGKNTFPFEGIQKLELEKEVIYKENEAILAKVKCVEDWKYSVEGASRALQIKDVSERYAEYVFSYVKKRKHGENKDNTNGNDVEVSSEKTKAKKIKEIVPCNACTEDDPEISCISCFRAYHLDCIGLIYKPNNFKCGECEGNRHKCEECKISDVVAKKCEVSKCLKFHHVDCIKKYGWAKFEHMCPTHICFTCFQDRPRSADARKGEMISCRDCNVTFHDKFECIPAGCIRLSSPKSVVCSYHLLDNCSENVINVNYCYNCGLAGSLVCCETCTSAFHKDCLEDGVLPEKYMCKDCEKGKYFYYHMIIWCKYGTYRFWPAKIIKPSDLPENAKKGKPGEFPVVFFGYDNYCWTNRARVVAYQVGHVGLMKKKCPSNDLNSQLIDIHFQKAILEAEKAFHEYQEYHSSVSSVGDTPDTYKSIKVNRFHPDSNCPVLKMVDPCECFSKSIYCEDIRCENVQSMFECDENVCKVGESCQNRKFRKRQYKNTEIIKTTNRGWGLITKENIKQGEFIIEYVGEVINGEEKADRYKKLREAGEKNYYAIDTGLQNLYIDAYVMGNESRFMNHSCDPNVLVDKWNVMGARRLGMFAVRDIPAGEELTFNYGSSEFQQTCYCGSSNCKGLIGTEKSSTEDLKGQKILQPRITAQHRHVRI